MLAAAREGHVLALLLCSGHVLLPNLIARTDFFKEPRACVIILSVHTHTPSLRLSLSSLGAHMLEAKDTPGPPTCTRHALYAFPLCKNADQSMRMHSGPYRPGIIPAFVMPRTQSARHTLGELAHVERRRCEKYYKILLLPWKASAIFIILGNI